jgi:hypothetical protein
LVEERTQAFLEEKKRSEELLYQVLPRWKFYSLRVNFIFINQQINGALAAKQYQSLISENCLMA